MEHLVAGAEEQTHLCLQGPVEEVVEHQYHLEEAGEEADRLCRQAEGEVEGPGYPWHRLAEEGEA
jgi:hypothetical protein